MSMRDLWSALVIRLPNVSIAWSSRSELKESWYQARRMYACAPSRSPWAMSARERKLALRSHRRFFGEEGTHCCGLHALDPQHRLGAPAQRADRGPTRVGGDEGGIAGKIGGGVVAA